MFIMCFFVWAVVVDNAILPSDKQLRQDNGVYTRFKVKNWQKGSKLDVIKDELMIYAVVDNREQLYYMDYNFNFANSLKNLPPGVNVQMRYVRRFPKYWKRHLYNLRTDGISRLSYNNYQLQTKQKEILKFTGIMAGIYLILAVAGFVGRKASH